MSHEAFQMEHPEKKLWEQRRADLVHMFIEISLFSIAKCLYCSSPLNTMTDV